MTEILQRFLDDLRSDFNYYGLSLRKKFKKKNQSKKKCHIFDDRGIKIQLNVLLNTILTF